jgi:hypothetical protein
MVIREINKDHFAVERAINELEREVWEFWFQDLVLWLDNYYFEERETKRHKFKIIRSYSRLHKRSYDSKMINEESVELPEEIVKAAIDFVAAQIVVKRWSERG